MLAAQQYYVEYGSSEGGGASKGEALAAALPAYLPEHALSPSSQRVQTAQQKQLALERWHQLVLHAYRKVSN